MATLTLDDYSPNEQRGEIVRGYSLIVECKALDYLSLLNGFSLDPLVCVVLFFIAGIATLTFYVVFWSFQRVFTRLQRPPKLAVRVYLSVIISPVRGCALWKIRRSSWFLFQGPSCPACWCFLSYMDCLDHSDTLYSAASMNCTLTLVRKANGQSLSAQVLQRLLV